MLEKFPYDLNETHLGMLISRTRVKNEKGVPLSSEVMDILYMV